MLGKGVGISPAIHSLKHTVGVVLFLLHDLVSEKLVITKDLASCRSRNRDRNNSTQISSWLVFIFLMLILSFLILFPCIHLFVQQMSYWFFNSFFLLLFNMICVNAVYVHSFRYVHVMVHYGIQRTAAGISLSSPFV